jgi:ATP-dependent protease HslVU (ClpYQ) ATPase subunit
MGLSGNPPLEIAGELRSLYDTVNLEKSMEQISFAASERERENVTITIPVKERNLLNVIVKKFGWACVF